MLMRSMLLFDMMIVLVVDRVGMWADRGVHYSRVVKNSIEYNNPEDFHVL